MTQWWQYWPRHFSDAECDKIVSLAETIPPTEGKIGHGGGNIKDDVIRRSTIRWINRYDGRFFSFLGNMELLLHQGNKNAFGFDLTMFHEIQFTEYHATNEGHYAWHHDTHWEGPQLIQRKLSMVIQLSNPADYEGGRFELSKDVCREVPNPDAILPRGTVIIFPSFLLHRVTPVTSGIRKSLVTWMEGPCFRYEEFVSNCNIDLSTGIHYGVIRWNDAAGLLFNWCDRSTAYAKNCKCRKNCRCENDGSYYQDHEYLCHANNCGEILVLKSPYYTLCGPCSPCVPNAGDLTSTNGVLPSYCLGPEWFDMDETPYAVLAVANKQLGVPYKRKRQNPVRR